MLEHLALEAASSRKGVRDRKKKALVEVNNLNITAKGVTKLQNLEEWALQLCSQRLI